MKDIKLITASIDRAIQYLLSRQHRDGHWEEYRLPVGSGDAWITGYVGFALAEASRVEPIAEVLRLKAREGAQRASRWLQMHRCYSSGWGYNGITGPDVDSTAWSLRLFLSLEEAIEERDINFLLSKMHVDGGFSTYDGPAYWGVSHPDVTPVVFLGLPRIYRAAIEAKVVGYVIHSRGSDGTWPSYWWRTCHYATLLNCELCAELGLTDAFDLPVVADDEPHGLHSNLDLACVLGIAAIRSLHAPILSALAHELLLCQRQDGMWFGAPDLRVTDPRCGRPWVSPRGESYEDFAGLITSATAIRALNHVVRELRRG